MVHVHLAIRMKCPYATYVLVPLTAVKIQALGQEDILQVVKSQDPFRALIVASQINK